MAQVLNPRRREFIFLLMPALFQKNLKFAGLCMWGEGEREDGGETER